MDLGDLGDEGFDDTLVDELDLGEEGFGDMTVDEPDRGEDCEDLGDKSLCGAVKSLGEAGTGLDDVDAGCEEAGQVTAGNNAELRMTGDEVDEVDCDDTGMDC